VINKNKSSTEITKEKMIVHGDMKDITHQRPPKDDLDGKSEQTQSDNSATSRKYILSSYCV
jgi:hypothetical protein